MKLEVGMYVRTENGVIEKVNRIYDRHTTDNVVVWLNGYGDGRSVFIDDYEEVNYEFTNPRGFIKKEPSFNIIDLIEVGDYVNGAKVNFVYRPDGKQIFRIELDVVGLKGHMICENKDIKSIVTKEQFESMSYKVEV